MRIITFAAIVFMLSSCNSKQKADLIVHNAVIYTVDSAFSTAQAMAVKGGKILYTGREEDVLSKYSAKDTIDAHGNAVYPGFIDAHAHFIGYAQSLFAVDLFGCTSEDEMIGRVQKFATEHAGEPGITGRGWDQNKFPGKQFPNNRKLNQLFPNTPVVLERVDGHALLVNDKALQLAGIKPGQTIAGGVIETINGKLTGILVDNAESLVGGVIPEPSRADMLKRLQAAEHNCFAQGLTTLTDCGLDYTVAEAIDTLQQQGKLNMHLYIMLSDDKRNYDRYLPRGPYKTGKLYIHGFKVYADGALGSRGACLLQPYSDKPGWTGFLLNTKEHYDSVAKLLSATDFQMCTHAIGDSGNRMILTAYGKYLNGRNDKRWRVEHAQIINPADFDLFGKSSIIPSVQPTHATSDMYWAGERLGAERLKGGYAYKQLLQQNGWIALGTDFPVEDISPFKTFLAAVFRVDAKGYPSGGFQMENALSREEAIRGMTIWAAKADFWEKETGSLEAGKDADFIILDKDLMKIKWDEVLQTKVLATYSEGKKVYGE